MFKIRIFNRKNDFLRTRTNINGLNVPRFDIEQADVAPLMSSLIGTAVPSNNLGKLPEQYLNFSEVCSPITYANLTI